MREHRQKLHELGYDLHMAKQADSEGAEHSILSRAAVAVRGRVNAYALAISDADTLALAETGRWTERLFPVRDGTSFIIVASLCGHSGSSWDPALARTTLQTNHAFKDLSIARQRVPLVDKK